MDASIKHCASDLAIIALDVVDAVAHTVNIIGDVEHLDGLGLVHDLDAIVADGLAISVEAKVLAADAAPIYSQVATIVDAVEAVEDVAIVKSRVAQLYSRYCAIM